MRDTVNVKLSLTEFPQFQRLVDFLVECEDYARVTDDWQLGRMAAECREELVEMGGAE